MNTTSCKLNAIKLQNNGKRLSDRVKTEVVEFALGKTSKGRRGAPPVKAGSLLYAIKYELGGYFAYSYVSKERAEMSRQLQIDNATNTFQFYGFNVVDTLDETLPVSELG